MDKLGRWQDHLPESELEVYRKAGSGQRVTRR